MNAQVPLERLVLNLLALAEAVPDLPPDVLARLAAQTERLAPTPDVLALVSARIQLELMKQPAFQRAKEAWNSTLPERHQLDLNALKNSLPSSPDRPASAFG